MQFKPKRSSRDSAFKREWKEREINKKEVATRVDSELDVCEL